MQRQIGIDGAGVPDGAQQGEIIDAVGVGEALLEGDVMTVDPLPHRRQLSESPDEPALEPPGEGAVRRGVAGRHHLVDAELVGERPDERLRRRRRQHKQVAGLPVLVEQGGHVRGDSARQVPGGGAPRLAETLDRPSADCQCCGPGKSHPERVLAEKLVQPVDDRLPRHLPRPEAGLVERLVDELSARAPQQRPVQIEDGGDSAHVHDDTHAAPADQRPSWRRPAVQRRLGSLRPAEAACPDVPPARRRTRKRGRWGEYRPLLQRLDRAGGGFQHAPAVRVA